MTRRAVVLPTAVRQAVGLQAVVRQRVGLPGNELFTGVIEEIKTFAASPKFDDDICLASVEVRRLEMKS